ncbi:MAG: GDSL-type esterase/lipase family protein [Cyanobacteria bacterium J06621_11]
MSKNINWAWFLVGLLTLLLGLSVTLNRMLWKRATLYYKESNATRLDPIGLKAFETTDMSEDRSKEGALTRVVFVGDSRAASWPSPVMSGYEFVNRGIGSQTSTQVLQRFSAHVTPLRPDVVVIQVGINDIKTIGLFPEQASEILSDVRSNILQLINQSEAAGAVVILSSILPPGRITLARRPFWSDEIDMAVVDVNAYLQAIATASDEDSIIWFDGYGAIVDSQGRMKRAYRADELHLNEAGYAALNQAFVEQFQSL